MTERAENLEKNKDPIQEKPDIVEMLNKHFLFSENIPPIENKTEIVGYKKIQDWFEASNEEAGAFVLYNNEEGEEESPDGLSYEDVVAILNLPFDRGLEFKPQFSESIEPSFDYNKIPELENNRGGEGSEKKGLWGRRNIYFHPTSNEKIEFLYSYYKPTKTAKLRLNCFK